MSVSLKSVYSDPELLLMTGFGSGLSPRAPGTVGSLVGLVLFLPLLTLPILVQIGVVVAGLIIGIFWSQRVAQALSIKDPGIIVWDEFVGMWIAMLWIPGLYWLPLAFVVFRLFDILKPWPVGWADRELEGGLGIMVDDVLAGLLTLSFIQAGNILVHLYL